MACNISLITQDFSFTQRLIYIQINGVCVCVRINYKFKGPPTRIDTTIIMLDHRQE